jgi:hypothetical protein
VKPLLLVTVVLLGAVAGLAQRASADPPPLYIVFRPDHTFAAYLADGTPVGTTSGAPSVIPAGTYKLLLDDTSETDMQLDLAGPGVKLVTDMSHAEEGSQAYLETFQPASTYTFRDDNRPGVVWTFTTSSEVLPTSGTTTTTCSSCSKPGKTSGSSDVVGSQADRGALAATVDPAGRLALTYKGRAVAKLQSGRYTITVVDKSPRKGFTLQGVRRPAQSLTGVALVGKRSRVVTLTPGQWTYFSPGGAKSYFLVVGA